MTILKKILLVIAALIILNALLNLTCEFFIWRPYFEKIEASRKNYLIDIKNYDLNKLIEGKYMPFEIDYKSSEPINHKPHSYFLCLEPYGVFSVPLGPSYVETLTETLTNLNCSVYVYLYRRNSNLQLLNPQRFSAVLDEKQKTHLKKLLEKNEINKVQIMISVTNDKLTYDLPIFWNKTLNDFFEKAQYQRPQNKYTLDDGVSDLLINGKSYKDL